MTNYLLSIDPSIKNTGFTLGEKIYKYDKNLNYGPTRQYVYCEIHNDDNASLKIIKECKNCYQNEIIGKPIGIKSYSFNKFTIKSSLDLKGEIRGVIIPDINTKSDNTYPGLEKFDLIIERGTFHSKNGIGYETQEHLRGFIAGQFNKLITKDMLISPSEGKKGYLSTDVVGHDKKGNKLNYKQGDKEVSFSFANHLVITNNGNITISNHDEADSLLIGGYYLNKENK